MGTINKTTIQINSLLDKINTVTKSDVGLSNVDNTSDIQKPISTATNAALALKADTTALTAGLALKADASTVTSALAIKADASTVTSELALKANVSSLPASQTNIDVITGTSTVQRLVSAEQLKLSVKTHASQPQPSSIFRATASVLENTGCPHYTRRISDSVSLFSFKSATPVVTNGTSSVVTDYVNRETTGGLRVDCTTSGSVSVTYSGLNINGYDPSKGYMITLYCGTATDGTNGFSFSIAGAGGKSQGWAISGTAFRRGWNVFYLPSVTNTVANAWTNQSGVVNLGATGGTGMGGTTITTITISFFATVAVNDFFILDTVEEAVVSKPAILWMWDQDDNTFQNNIVPMLSAAGLIGSVRFHSLTDTLANRARVDAAVNADWDIYNGTLTRLNTGLTQDLLNKELALNQNIISRRYGQICTWGSTGGNATFPKSIMDITAPQIGLKYFRTGNHRAIAHGLGGVGERYRIGCTGTDGLSLANFMAYVDGAISAGTPMVLFGHSYDIAQNTTYTELQGMVDYLATKKTDGLVDVVNSSQMTDILDGKY
jgi:hypothetical protein